MNTLKTILFCIIMEIMIIVCVASANVYSNPLWYFFFYNILYGVVFSFLIPIFLLRKERNMLYRIGVKPFGRKQIVVLILFVAISVGGQLVPIAASGGIIPWNLLPMGMLPLVMTTFFEEFLFRGFFQSSLEKDFGAFPAVIMSGLMFSLYHVGYPGFRTSADIVLLFVVGVGFAVSYKLSDNNLIVSYFVNLPNAFVTYMLKFKQFPVMKISSTIASIITLCIIVFVFIALVVSGKTNNRIIVSHERV